MTIEEMRKELSGKVENIDPIGKKVVVVLTGHGLKDPDTVIREAKMPVKLPNSIETLEAYV